MVEKLNTCSPVHIPPQYIEAFRAKALELHNKYRRMHGCLPLSSNSLHVRNIAEEYAKELATGYEIKHNPELRNLRVGENLSLFMSPKLYDLNEADFEYYAERSVTAWYNEINLYDFDKCEFSHETGHFTQIIWKETSIVEFAVSLTNKPDEKGRYYLYIVANYSKPGNYKNRFKFNVPPPLIKNSSIENLNYPVFKNENRKRKSIVIDNRIFRNSDLDLVAKQPKTYKKSKSKVDFLLLKNQSSKNLTMNNDFIKSNTKLQKTKSHVNLVSNHAKTENKNHVPLRKSKSDAVLMLNNQQLSKNFKSAISLNSKSKKDSTFNSSSNSSNAKLSDNETFKTSQNVEERIKSYEKMNEKISQVIQGYLNKNNDKTNDNDRKKCLKKSNSINKLSAAVIHLNRKDNLYNNLILKCKKLILTKLNQLNMKYLKS